MCLVHISAYSTQYWGVGITQSVWRIATGWTVRGSNPGWSKILSVLHIGLEQPSDRPIPPYNG